MARLTRTCHRPFRSQAGGFDCQGNRNLRWPRSTFGGRQTNALTQQETDALIHQKRRKSGHSDFLRGIEKSGVFFPHQYTHPVRPPALDLTSRITRKTRLQCELGSYEVKRRKGFNKRLPTLFRPLAIKHSAKIGNSQTRYGARSLFCHLVKEKTDDP